MGRPTAIKWKSVFLGIIALLLFSCAYVLLTLFAIPVEPIEHKAPPKLVQQADASVVPIDVQVDEAAPPLPAPTPGSPSGTDIEALAKGVFFEGQSSEAFAALFGHPDQAVWEAASLALALCWTANMGMAEPRAEGEALMRRYEFMENFWADADKPTVLKALVEVVSKAVEAGRSDFNDGDYQVLYLLSGFPGHKTQRAEVVAWVANHHPSDDMRRAAVFFLVNRDFPREIGDEVLASRAHDPSRQVRFEAFIQRMKGIF